MYQRWEHLYFLHWEYPASLIQSRLPKGLYVDLYEGKSYMAIVPFSMRSLRLNYLPTFPGISNFIELNLRTYVHDDQGRPGVWFFSLEADSFFSVFIANYFFSLPYQMSKLHFQSYNNRHAYKASAKRDVQKNEMVFEFESNGHEKLAERGSLESFLVERYRLFTYNQKSGKLLTGCIQHNPYLVSDAKVLEISTHLFKLNSMDPPAIKPCSVLYSPGTNVAVFPLKSIH